MLSNPVYAIFGPPGTGKTTAAVPLADRLHATYISSGDIARRVDPESLANGQMADRALLRNGFLQALDEAVAVKRPIVIDGLPRDPSDLELLPAGTIRILLSCLPSVSIERQLRRARPGDTPAVIETRTFDQFKLMQMDDPAGWPFRSCEYIADTTEMSASQLAMLVQRWALIEREGMAKA